MTKQSYRWEVGYILLEECEVLCVDPAKSDQAAKCAANAASAAVWYELDLRGDGSTNGVDKDQQDNLELPDDGCDLILQPIPPSDCSDGKHLSWTNANALIPFNGLTSEIPIDGSRKKRRSDTSLLVGLAVEINNQAHQFQQETLQCGGANPESEESLHLRHLRMENAQIMFWGDGEPINSQSIDTNGEYDSSMRTRKKASLLITFSLPKQACSNNPNPLSSEERLKEMQSKKTKPKSKLKMLSSAYQLVASIIRCDWNNLDRTMKLLQHKALSATSVSVEPANSTGSTRFFPESLKVEELYARISGASKHFNGENHQLRKAYKPANASSDGNENVLVTEMHATKPADFLDLPSDIIATSISTYLRPKSLHALRVTCQKVYSSLREVVPGLKLKLFQHQVTSLEWMELRERQCITEGELLCNQQERGCEVVSGGDYHRAVSGGATVLLAPRPNVTNGQLHHSRMYRFGLDSGYEVASLECASERKTLCARGGLLCDDPGLGKTITIISLILRSFGLSTTCEIEHEQDKNDESLFHLYWPSSFLNDHVQRRPAIMKLISNIIKSDRESGWFVPPIDQFLQDCPDYFDIISTPICLQDIRAKYSKSNCSDFKAFEADVTLCFSNAMKYNPPDHSVHKAAQRLLKNFEALMAKFKRDQIIIASKSMHRYRSEKEPSARSLVDAFEAKKRNELQKSLVPSSSTLLVVPAPLLDHWQEQMMLHVDFQYLSKPGLHSPFIYYHTSKRNISINSKVQSLDLNHVTNPIIFIDDGSKELPPASVLARFPIVLTSHSRFTSEWKNGSIEQETRASKRGTGNSALYWGDDEPEASPLLKVLWLRVIVDEGHVMGKNTSNLIQFTSWLSSERTWAMTGTPTQQIATQNGLKNLYYLTNFLKHDFFNRQLGREKSWSDLISSGWQSGCIASFFRLKHLLSYLMVRHTKADLVEIPQPMYTAAQIKLSQSETTTYNTIVSGIRTNLITTSMEGKTSGWQDSLLNPRQSRHASEALTNLRIACCGGAQILPSILTSHWNETLIMLREIHNLDEVKVQLVNNFISRAQFGELSGCHSCGVQLQLLLVVPCAHLVCTECIDSTTATCPVCHSSFDVDDFQKLQPGFNNQFCLELQREKEEREKQQALDQAISESTWPAIEINEARDIGGNRPNDTQIRSHRRGESCVYTSSPRDGRCRICREEHFDCNFMNREQTCTVCFKHAEQCPSYASKASYMIDKLLQLRKNDVEDECNVSPIAARVFSKSGARHRPLKAIIFSQFRSSYEYLGDRLIRRFGGACVADFSYNRTRSSELNKFIHDPACFVMLLSKQGSVGLDLSFVTHIFFLDSIYDKSLEEQVVARAYRMGATGHVTVEQLVAKDSIEETIIQMNSELANVETATSENQAKVHRLLKSARLIKPHLEHKKRNHNTSTNVNREERRKAAKLGNVRFNI